MDAKQSFFAYCRPHRRGVDLCHTLWFSRPDCRYRHRTLADWRRIARLGVIESPRADSNRRLADYRRFRIAKALLALSSAGLDRLLHLVCQLFGQRDCLAQRTLPAAHRREDETAAERKCTVRNADMFILDRVTGSDRSVTDYVLERAAKQECMSVIHSYPPKTDRRCDFCEFSIFFNTPQLTNSRPPFATNAMDNVVVDGFTRDVSKQISEHPAAQFADRLKNDIM